MEMRSDQEKRPKRVLCVRVSESGYDHIEKRAGRADVPVSHMARRMLAYASAHMPEGWVPNP